ncbi:multidrug transporter [Marinobacter sp. R17]|uniref:DsrE family protein n=1 Tax=Marinobacter sp. R17 TaxID=2484250 RepID=UPI000F4C0171|nr:DsrE family protein [Marinobacter sp. R17]ROU01681.1 multidrug transporter [Marinobacter sp. R17]
MSDYLFIQSQDPYTEARAEQQFELAAQLHDAGHNVRILLIQNGVTPARKGARLTHFDSLLAWGITVLADGFSLKQREIGPDDLKYPVWISDIDVAVESLLEGHKVIWN